MIEDKASLTSLCQRLHSSKLIAVDTEADSMHRYKEKVCLIQISASGEDFLIDPFLFDSLEPLRDIFEDPNHIKIFHDAGYDLIGLQRDFDLGINGLFDTMWASRLLGYERFGLAAILDERYEFCANKTLQRSDWAQRPLTQEQVDYARFDTFFLEDLSLHLVSELKKVERMDWALEDFVRIQENAKRLMGRQRLGQEDAWWRIKGVKKLTPEAKGRAKELFYARDRIAQRVDRPAFKVFNDQLILDLAENPPASKDDLLPRRGLKRAGIQRCGTEIMRAISASTPVHSKAPHGTGRKRFGRFIDPDIKVCYENLRNMRRRVSEKLGVDPEVALTNHVLEHIARNPPQVIEELRDEPLLVGWRLPFFAEEIMAVVKMEQLESPPHKSDRTA
jgi:ribonuclease D